MREVLNAIFYLLVNGCAWRNLPHAFPPEGTVRDYFHQWRRTGLLCRNYECWTETSEAVVKMAMIHIMIRRLA